MFKKTLIGFGVLLVLVFGSALIAPSFIDWNARLPEIAAEVKKATGRDLSIDGKLEVHILPAPMITARGVKLGNMAGGTVPYMVTLDAVEVRVALMPLLSGEVQVERISLVNPIINIEKNADGRSNLEFQSETPETGIAEPKKQNIQKSSKGTSSPLGIRLDNFEIKNATLIYINGAAGTTERVDHLDATLRAASLQGPFEAKGEAHVRGIPLSFDLSLGQIISNRTVPMDANIKAGGASVQLSGALFGLETEPHFKGKAKVEGENLAELLKAIGGSVPSSPVLAKNFALDSTVYASAKMLDLADIEIQFAASRATGTAAINLSENIQFDVNLNVSHVDVDALLASNGKGMGSSFTTRATNSVTMTPKPPQNGKAHAKDTGFSFPDGVSGNIQLVVDSLTLKEGLVRDMRLNAELSDGELTVSQFQLQAPGVTDLALFGFVKPKDGVPEFEGDLEILTSDPQGLSSWLGIKLPKAVNTRLKRVSVATKVYGNTEQVMLSNLKITGDRSTLTGGVTVALRSRPSFGVDLSLDTLNLDTYLNGNGHAVTSSTTSSSSSAQTTQTTVAAKPALDVLQIWTALNALNDFDANIKFKVGSLTAQGKKFTKLAVDSTLFSGKLDVRDLSVGNALGANGKISGSFSGFGGIVEMADVKISGKVKKASVFAGALGLKDVPKNLGTVSLNSTINGSVLKPRFRTTVKALSGTYALEGSYSLLPFGFGYNGTFRVNHPNADKLLSTLNIGYAPKGPLGAVHLQGKLKSDGQIHTVTGLNGAIGDLDLSGDVRIKTGKSKPNIVADLKTGLIKVDTFAPRTSPKAKKTAALPKNPLLVMAAYSDTQPQRLAKSSLADKRWSNERFDLSVLHQLNGDVTLLADGIQFGEYLLENADIHANIKDGVLNADRVKGHLFGGPVNGSAQVRADGNPTLTTNIKLSALDVGRATKAVTGTDMAGGKLALNIDFEALGFSPAEMIRSLGGSGGLDIVGLDVKKSGSGSALSGVIGLVAAMNKMSLSSTKGPEKGLADIGLSFNISDGIASVKDFALKSGLGNGQGAGTVDLANWTVDFAGKMKMEANLITALLSKGRISIQEIPFSLSGALDKPNVNFMSGLLSGGGASTSQNAAGASALQKLLGKALPGLLPSQPKTQPAPTPALQDGTLAPPPSQRQAPAPAPSGKLTPEEMIRQLMQGL